MNSLRQSSLILPEKREKLKEFLASGCISYLITVFLDWFFFMEKREIRIDNYMVSIDRPDSIGNLLLWYLAIAGLAGLIYLIIYCIDKHQEKIKTGIFVKLIAPSVFIVIAIITLMIFNPIPQVETVTEISGHIKEKNRYGYLFIRPILHDECWLQRPSPLQLDQNGRWRVSAYFGGSSGERFEILTIVSKKELNHDKYLEPGRYPCNSIPLDVEKFVRIVQMN